MQDLHYALHTLDHLYFEASLEEYEYARQVVEAHIQQILPGFTVAYALEIGTVGVGDTAYYHGGVMHVLFPLGEQA